MKKLSLLHKAAAAVMGVALIASACGEIDNPKFVDGETGILSVNFNMPGAPATKAFTDPINSDMTARGLQVIVFDANGNFYDVITKDNSNKYQKEVPAGTYTVVAVANGTQYTDATAPTLSALEAVSMSLAAGADNIAEVPASGMARFGKSDPVTVTAAGATANVTAKILAFRVTMAAVNLTGDAAGRLTLTNCFLENIYGNSTLGGTVSNFKNQGGRTGWGNQSVLSAAADAFGGEMTFNTVSAFNDHKKAFYAYQNQAAADNFNGPIAENGVAYTRLVIAGSWKQSASATAETVYYPITISHDLSQYVAPKGGYSYDVTATISKKGSDDPNKPVPEGAGLNVNVDVAAWAAGPDHNVTF